MKLMISELTTESFVDRSTPWMDEVDSYLATVAFEEEIPEIEELPSTGRTTTWLEIRLSTFRHLITGGY